MPILLETNDDAQFDSPFYDLVNGSLAENNRPNFKKN